MSTNFKDIKDYIRIPLISKTGKAMKFPLPKSIRKNKSPSQAEHLITLEEAQKELKKLEYQRMKQLKEENKPRICFYFKSISRSSNVSPLSTSPAPGSYHPKYDFLEHRVIGNIKYRNKPQEGSKSSRTTKVKLAEITPKKLSFFSGTNLFEALEPRAPMTPLKSAREYIASGSPSPIRNLTPLH